MARNRIEGATKKEIICKEAIEFLKSNGPMGLYRLTLALNEDSEVIDFPVHSGFVYWSLGTDNDTVNL